MLQTEASRPAVKTMTCFIPTRCDWACLILWQTRLEPVQILLVEIIGRAHSIVAESLRRLPVPVRCVTIKETYVAASVMTVRREIKPELGIVVRTQVWVEVEE